MSQIYVLWLEANFVPDDFISKGYCAAAHARLREAFPHAKQIRQVLFEARPPKGVQKPWAKDAVYCPGGIDEFMLSLRPGDVVIGGVAVQSAAKLCARGVQIYSHHRNGDLFKYSARCDEKPILRNPPWNDTGKPKAPEGSMAGTDPRSLL